MATTVAVMVKLICMLKRKPGMSQEDFYSHWFDVHGPLIRTTEPINGFIRRYEQHRAVDGPEAMTNGWDGVTIQWYDSMEDFVAFSTHPRYLEVIAVDEQSFLDMDSLVYTITEVPTVTMDGPLT